MGRCLSQTGNETVQSQSLLDALISSPMRAGTLVWIGVRPERRAPLIEHASAELIAGNGIAGDHYRTLNNGARQVTLIAAEDVAAIAAFLGQERVDPQRLRRNLVCAGINVLALKGMRFRIGAALLEGSGFCAPCSRMEENMGVGGFNAVRGRGGITARVLEAGVIRLGDTVETIAVDAAPAAP